MIDSAHFALSELGHMNQVSATPPVRFIRFGLFEADLQAGELRKNGLKIKLQEQPFRVLSLLLERAGEVVTREELRQKLWSTDTFVDFDHGLNTADQKTATGAGGFGRQSSLCRDPGPPRLSVHCAGGASGRAPFKLEPRG